MLNMGGVYMATTVRGGAAEAARVGLPPVRFVFILGFERYGRDLFAQVEAGLKRRYPAVSIGLYSEQDLLPCEPCGRAGEGPRCAGCRAIVAADIARADCLFMTLITDRTLADPLIRLVASSKARVVFAFESLPEVMALTRVGAYEVNGSAGMPDSVKRVASLLVHGREEDAFYGYMKLQKLTNRLLRFMPSKGKAGDVRTWMTVYAYWNNPDAGNLGRMIELILKNLFSYPIAKVDAVREIPTMGLFHPDAPEWFRDLDQFERWAKPRWKGKTWRARIALLCFRKHLLQGEGYGAAIVRELEAQGIQVLPCFVAGVEAHVVVREWFGRAGIDCVVSTLGFPLVGGPAGSSKAGVEVGAAQQILSRLDVPYIAAPPLYAQSMESWQTSGVGGMGSVIMHALPEMDGAVQPVVLGALEGDHIRVVPDRVQRLATLVAGWAALRRTACSEKRIALVVYNYPPGMGRVATAALLDVPASLHRLLGALAAAGYHTGPLPASPDALLADIEASMERDSSHGEALGVKELHGWLSPEQRRRVEARWGQAPGDIAPLGRERIHLGGVRYGNVYLGVQPMIGVTGDPMRLLFDRENTPHHQYLAFYRWLERRFKAHAIVHVGMHGSAEWMPGVGLGPTADCWPDVLLGGVPNFYLYPTNNPSEANIAKRRGMSITIGHAIPPYGRAGLYRELALLKDLLAEARAGHFTPEIDEAIDQKVALLNLADDLPRRAGEDTSLYHARLYAYLGELESRLISGTLHVIGQPLGGDAGAVVVAETLKAYSAGPSLAELVAARLAPGRSYPALAAGARAGSEADQALREQIDAACLAWSASVAFGDGIPAPAFEAALDLAAGTSGEPERIALAALAEHGRTMALLLADNGGETANLLHGLDGGYIPAGPGGDLLRDGAAVLPTGRNIHSLDPWRLPSSAALARGLRIADALVDRHLEETGGYPQTVAQVLWGLDTIKTKGEALATVLGLIGARPAYDEWGKVSAFELLPLQELERPRIDVLVNISSIFRDTFPMTMDLLDRLVRAAAEADEPADRNYLKAHVAERLAAGATIAEATARLFTQAPGTYGTYVDDSIEGAQWQQQGELADVFVRRNQYAYGGAHEGEAQGETLRALLGSVARVSQEIDSVEYGVTDIEHYYAHSGAVRLAAQQQQGSGAAVPLSYVETFTSETRVQDVAQVLRLEYRTKLLNPTWYEGMLKHNHSGAAEISNRFTHMLGWSAVGDEVDNWVFDESAATYILDAAMRARIEAANPQAMRNMVGRLLEANGRSLWQVDESTIAELQSIYADLEDRLEGV